MKEKLKDRYNILALSFITMISLIILQFANLQIINGERYDEESQNRILSERKILAERGNVVDRHGVPIAVNRTGFNVQIMNMGLKGDSLNQMVLKLATILDRNNEAYCTGLENYLTFQTLGFGKRLSESEQALEKWKSEMVLKEEDIKLLDTPRNVFEYFRKTKFKIDNKYTDEEAYKIMKIRYDMLIQGYSALRPLRVAQDVKEATVAQIEEQSHDLPGVTTTTEPMRRYIDAGMVAHTVGYVRGISEEQYEEWNKEGYEYGKNDVVGKAGIELAAQNDLRGIDGLKRVEVDMNGRLTDEFVTNPAIPGNNVVLTLNTKLQKVAMESLAKNIELIRSQADGKQNFGDAMAGAAVAIDVNSGEILAMANYPSYDPSIFLAGPEDTEAQKALSDLYDEENEAKPSLNRAIYGLYAPGSTFKPLTAIAALEEGVITPDEEIYDSGTTTIGGWKFTCLEYRMGLGAHGKIKLKRALATSCNIYFHEIGYQTGIDSIEKWARYFGLGEPLGLDIGGWRKGIVANREYKKEVEGYDWYPADTAQAAIGQLYNNFSPLQLANYISTVANGGKRYTPHLIKRIEKPDGSIVKETQPQYEQIPVKPETIAAVKEGMEEVLTSYEGTAAQAFKGFPYKVGGKTGTAETGREANHSSNALFVCYAPAGKPEIAVAVVVERGAWGTNTAPIARDILEEYFGIYKGDDAGDQIIVPQEGFTR